MKSGHPSKLAVLTDGRVGMHRLCKNYWSCVSSLQKDAWFQIFHNRTNSIALCCVDRACQTIHIALADCEGAHQK